MHYSPHYDLNIGIKFRDTYILWGYQFTDDNLVQTTPSFILQIFLKEKIKGKLYKSLKISTISSVKIKFFTPYF